MAREALEDQCAVGRGAAGSRFTSPAAFPLLSTLHRGETQPSAQKSEQRCCREQEKLLTVPHVVHLQGGWVRCSEDLHTSHTKLCSERGLGIISAPPTSPERQSLGRGLFLHTA